jgi:hypothetical protein
LGRLILLNTKIFIATTRIGTLESIIEHFKECDKCKRFVSEWQATCISSVGKRHGRHWRGDREYVKHTYYCPECKPKEEEKKDADTIKA